MIKGKELLAVVMIIAGFKVLFVKQFWSQGAFHDFSNPLLYIPISGFLIIGGCLLMLNKRNEKWLSQSRNLRKLAILAW